MAPEPKYFATAAAWRKWLAANHAKQTELIVGFHKRASGTPCMTWPESVDQALCHGWIDGVRKRVDDERYQIRFTPRKSGSIWSAVNIARVEVLTAEGLMTPAGVRAFEARTAGKSRVYAYEQKEHAALAPAEEALFKADAAAWHWFTLRAPSYRKRMLWWIVSAKQATTRERRLASLIDASAKQQLL